MIKSQVIQSYYYFIMEIFGLNLIFIDYFNQNYEIINCKFSSFIILKINHY